MHRPPGGSRLAHQRLPHGSTVWLLSAAALRLLPPRHHPPGGPPPPLADRPGAAGGCRHRPRQHNLLDASRKATISSSNSSALASGIDHTKGGLSAASCSSRSGRPETWEPAEAMLCASFDMFRPIMTSGLHETPRRIGRPSPPSSSGRLASSQQAQNSPKVSALEVSSPHEAKVWPATPAPPEARFSVGPPTGSRITPPSASIRPTSCIETKAVTCGRGQRLSGAQDVRHIHDKTCVHIHDMCAYAAPRRGGRGGRPGVDAGRAALSVE
mmetsp:Transcript_17091/g.57565  ORF Transcript_17091/g.57565 Transcript_17091/m.57565 type:complete len:270 (-) Transcript_17091:418-1227(-)